MGPPFVLLEVGALARIARSKEGLEVAYGILRPTQVAGVAGVASGPDLGLVLTAWLDSVTLEWPVERIRALAAIDGAFALDLLNLAIELAAALTAELEELRSVSAETRLARILIRYPDLLFDAERPRLRRGTIATLMGTSREMMERCLRALESERIIERTGSHGLILLDTEALRRVAG